MSYQDLEKSLPALEVRRKAKREEKVLAKSVKPIEVIVFPGGHNWPIWIAQEKGFFERNHVAINITATPNSVFQLTRLIDGQFDIAMTAIDNVIAYVEGQGEAPTSSRPDLVAFMGGDNGLLRLVTVPEVKTYADLKGRELSVDARTTGYAFVLQKLLEKGGLRAAEYELVMAGGVVQRFEALMTKRHAGTLLVSPFEVAAEAHGFNRLANATDVLGHYQGLVGAARRSWAKKHQAALIAFIRSYLAGLEWLYEPDNKSEAILILKNNLPKMGDELARKSYQILVDPSRGIASRAGLDLEGIRTVLALRTEYGIPRKQLSNPGKYYDLTAYHKAQQPV